MQFNSLEFLIFLALFFVGWPFFRRGSQRRWLYLTVGSFFFYGWWDWRFIFLLLANGMVDYLAAWGMVRFPRWKGRLLLASLAANIGCLATFKYLEFFLANINSLFQGLGWSLALPIPHLILPIGISFYTFQSMSYTIDVYRGRIQPVRNVLHFFAYLSLFPQLVAGPIVRASDLLPQLLSYQKTTESQRWAALKLVILGFFKKMVVADNLAFIVNLAFDSHRGYESSLYWWLIMLLFAVQIYCDFSGYSDIARGLAQWMGYDFPVNFRHPYIAGSFRDFWSRWHISLSTWFRDYVYIPLGGSRRGVWAGHINLWLAMLLSGLWHGAAWTFLLWGVFHAVCLSGERLTRWPERLARLPGGKYLSIIIVFSLVLAGWVFFRARSLDEALTILKVMFSLQQTSDNVLRDLISYKALFFAGLILGCQWLDVLRVKDFSWMERWLPARLAAIAQPVGFAVVMAMCLFFRGPNTTFIYFQF